MRAAKNTFLGVKTFVSVTSLEHTLAQFGQSRVLRKAKAKCFKASSVSSQEELRCKSPLKARAPSEHDKFANVRPAVDYRSFLC